MCVTRARAKEHGEGEKSSQSIGLCVARTASRRVRLTAGLEEHKRMPRCCSARRASMEERACPLSRHDGEPVLIALARAQGVSCIDVYNTVV